MAMSELDELDSSYSLCPSSGKAQNVHSHLMGMRVRIGISRRSSAGQCLSLCQLNAVIVLCKRLVW
jgi:hypothetical protein